MKADLGDALEVAQIDSYVKRRALLEIRSAELTFAERNVRPYSF